MTSLVLAFLIGSTAHATAPLAPSDFAKFQDCVSDEDCAYVQNGSCDCNNGGTTIAINRKFLTEFKKSFEAATCTEIKGASCTNGTPKCEQNKCLYYAHVIPHVYTGKGAKKAK